MRALLGCNASRVRQLTSMADQQQKGPPDLVSKNRPCDGHQINPPGTGGPRGTGAALPENTTAGRDGTVKKRDSGKTLKMSTARPDRKDAQQKGCQPERVSKATIIAYVALGSPSILAYIMIGATVIAEDYPGNLLSRYIVGHRDLINQSLMMATIPLAAITAAMRKVTETFFAGLQPGLVYMAGIVTGQDATIAATVTAAILIGAPILVVAAALAREETGHQEKEHTYP